MAVLMSVARDWSLLSITGLALVVIFKSTGVFNLAQGQLMLLTAYVAAALHHFIGAGAAAIVAVLLQIPIAVVMYRILKRLIDRQALWAAAIATVAIGLMIEAFMAIRWGAGNISVPAPFPVTRVSIAGFRILTTVDLVAITIALLLLIGVIVGQRRTRVGVLIRACGEAPLLASLTGVRIQRVFLTAWAVGLSLAAIAALLYSYRLGANPGLIHFGLMALVPALVGGLDSLGGVFVGAAVTAVVMQLAVQTLGGQAATSALFAVILITLLVRPRGIFGMAVAERA